eukprot:m.89318 g.89318  ORF g.89318 m.89318 type:complete len:89 (+) comp20051_c0_seq1:82-348(+)
MSDGWPKSGTNRHKKPRQLTMEIDRQGGGLMEHGFASGKIIHLDFYHDFTDDLLLLAPPQARSNLDKAVQIALAQAMPGPSMDAPMAT